jgi:hypothetical protein
MLRALPLSFELSFSASSPFALTLADEVVVELQLHDPEVPRREGLRLIEWL